MSPSERNSLADDHPRREVGIAARAVVVAGRDTIGPNGHVVREVDHGTPVPTVRAVCGCDQELSPPKADIECILLPSGVTVR